MTRFLSLGKNMLDTDLFMYGQLLDVEDAVVTAVTNSISAKLMKLKV